MIKLQAHRQVEVDEISDFQNARYISSNEAAWRIMDFQFMRDILLSYRSLCHWLDSVHFDLCNQFIKESTRIHLDQ